MTPQTRNRSLSLPNRPQERASDSSSMAIPWTYRIETKALSSEEIATLKKWVRRHWGPDLDIVQIVKTDTPARQLLVQKATELCQKNEVPVGRVRTWTNQQLPDASDGDYPSIYPHRHARQPGVTLIFYLDAGPEHPPLEILTDDHSVEIEIPAQTGTVVLTPNGVWHQVRKNRSDRPRIAAICEVYP